MARKLLCIVLSLVLITSALIIGHPQETYATAESFFAPAQTSGSMTVKLYPMENVTPGTSKLVTFGVPFTRGSMTVSNLSKVRVLKGGSEIPAYVEQLTPWRHLTNPSLDGQYVRVARIQINYTFSVSYPNYETITVQWGTTNRTQNISTFTDPKTAWHKVTSGTFTSADNVYEPDVYAVLPVEVLNQGVLNGRRSLPIDSSVSPSRDDPYVMDATDDYPGFLEYDHSIKNFFYSIINEDDPKVTAPNQCNYKTDSEPWLYDRSSAVFSLYFKSGFIKALREAVRSTQFYKNQIWPGSTTPERAIGLFKLKCPDPNGWWGGNGAMYSYNECFAYNYWLTGDDDVLDHIKWVNAAHEVNDEPTRWSPSLTTWTERHTAFRLLSNIIAYEVFGAYNYSASGKSWNVKDNILSQSEDFIWHQNGAGGLLPGNRVDGALYHYGRQHGDGQSDVLVASTWMSALTADAMVRAYFLSEDSDIANFVRRLAMWEKQVLKYDSNHIYDTYSGPLRYPCYMVRWDGQPDYASGGDGSEIEHAIELASTIAWGGYFADLLGMGNPDFYQKASDLYYSYNKGVNYWTRPAGPDSGKTAYRVSPWRKYGWEYRTTGSLSWLMGQITAPGDPTPTPTQTPSPSPSPSTSPTPTPSPGSEIVIFKDTQNFTFVGGTGTGQVVSGEGVGGSACIKYTNLELWRNPPALDFSSNPIDISSLSASDKLQLSVDHGNCLETNRYVFVYFNGYNDSAHRVNTGYLDNTAGYQTITLDIGSIRANLGNTITQVGFSAGNGWSSTMTFWVDEIKFIKQGAPTPTPSPSPTPGSDIVIFENTQNFVFGSGTGTAQVVSGEGVGGSSCIKYTNLQLWKTPPVLDFSANPIDISNLAATDKLKISVDHGNCTESNRYVFVFFNGYNDSAHRVNTGYLDTTAGYQTLLLDISSIRANLGNTITQVGFHAGNGWSSSMSFWVDDIKFVKP